MSVRTARAKTLTRLGLVAGLAAAAAAVTAPTASATTAHGCEWPRVCFYLTDGDWDNGNGTPTAAFQDVTSSYQNLGSRSRGANWAYNSRNDDRVFLRYIRNSTGATESICVNPNTVAKFTSDFTVTGIRIETASSC
ncbi:MULTISPECIES: hypothetical protein [Streptomyces]|uniref:Peptidase inhibitor family I36 n=2 Tax=Streptomyces TaxID=1883 RepID=A0ABV9IZP2_9ACTN